MEVDLSEMDDKALSKLNDVRAVPFWTKEKCLEFLGWSLTKQEKITGWGTIKAVDLRALVLDRLREIIEELEEKEETIKVQEELLNTSLCLIDKITEHVDRYGKIETDVTPLNVFPFCSFTDNKEEKIKELIIRVKYRIECLENYRNNYISPAELKALQAKTAETKMEKEMAVMRKNGMASLRAQLKKK